MNSKKSSREILLEILTIIDYKDNKDAFISKFLKLCMKKSLLDILLVASDNDKQKIIELSETNLTPEQLEGKLKDIVGKDILNSNLEKSTKEIFSQYLETLYPTLSTSQNQSLRTYLNSL